MGGVSSSARFSTTVNIRYLRSVVVLSTLLIAACGGGGGGGESTPPTTSTPPPQPPAPLVSRVTLDSEPGDYIGGGSNFEYTKADSQLTLSVSGNLIEITVDGDQRWSGSFQLPESVSRIETGLYEGMTRYPFHSNTVGGLSWSGEGRGCNELTGSVDISTAEYTGNTLEVLELSFEQRCDNSSGILRGELVWDVNDETSAPGPVVPVPSTLWAPSANTIPVSGNVFYLESDSGDYVGDGRTYLYTNQNADLSLMTADRGVQFGVIGDERWTGDFQHMDSIAELEPGYYPDLTRFPFGNPRKGALSWSGEGRSCGSLEGWFVIDDVTYDTGMVASIEMRFEQRCSSSSAALNGFLRWSAADTSVAPGPQAPPADLWSPASGTTPNDRNFVYLESESGDPVGQGSTYLYTQSEAVLTPTVVGSGLNFNVQSTENWNGDFDAMNSIDRLQPGYYDNVGIPFFGNPTRAGMDWSGNLGNRCNALSGWFVIDSIVYDGASLASLELRFEQRCDGASGVLRGAVTWDVNDSTAPPGPINPPPAGLWEPPSSALPDTGNFLYFESEPGDYIGAGLTYLYTQANADISVVAGGSFRGPEFVEIGVNGNEDWFGEFITMDAIDRLEVGYYPNVGGFPEYNPVTGGMSWRAQSRGCNDSTGWFVIDRIEFSGDELTLLEARFQHSCVGQSEVLNGMVRWDINDTTRPTGPVPPPADLWTPDSSLIPAQGSYVILESRPGDFIGAGRSYRYTLADSLIDLAVFGARMELTVDGDEGWNGTFQGMNTISQLEVGYYGNLQRYPFNNPVFGGLSWTGEGRGCNTLTGWFVIDSIEYVNGVVEAVEMRFQQNCEGGSAPLNGAIRWDINDMTTPPGPVPIPDTLWEPAPGIVPDTGSYVYLESRFGDFVGNGGNYLYTKADAVLATTVTGARLEISVGGDETWFGTFQGMNSISQLETGFYDNLERYPFHNPVRGGLSWTGEGRGCNRLSGWFAIDNIVYDGLTPQLVEWRFAQFCDGSSTPLRGSIRWDANDNTVPPGPVNPPPSGLWTPPSSVIPATGNFIYLESQPGDFIGAGQNYLYDSGDFSVSDTGARLTLNVNQPERWRATFQAMNSISRLEAGYYGDLERFPFHNPTRGGLSWSGEGRGCNRLTGWFVVDSVEYQGIELTAIELRFQQNCEGGSSALNGVIRWSR